jgi:hypothetical protein
MALPAGTVRIDDANKRVGALSGAAGPPPQD